MERSLRRFLSLFSSERFRDVASSLLLVVKRFKARCRLTVCLTGYARTPYSHSSRPNQRLRRLETGRPYKCAAVQAVEVPRVERGIRVDPQRTARGHYGLENASYRDIVDI